MIFTMSEKRKEKVAKKIRKIAKRAFKSQFSDVEIIRINIKPWFDHDGDPVVDVNLIYDGSYKQLKGGGRLMQVQHDILSKAWHEVEDVEKDTLGFPLVHFISKSDIGKRDPATV